jgi:hypothetical protein
LGVAVKLDSSLRAIAERQFVEDLLIIKPISSTNDTPLFTDPPINYAKNEKLYPVWMKKL